VDGDVSGGWLAVKYIVIARSRISKHVNTFLGNGRLLDSIRCCSKQIHPIDNVEREALFVLYELLCNTKTCYAKDHIPSKL
jgi:hypothetical protein